MISVVKYNKNFKKEWDVFISNAKNAHFMFYRDYMEYHSDVFEDHSLLFLNEDKKLIALLPANMAENKLSSHQGLTFGGIISDIKMKTSLMMMIFDCLLSYAKANEIKEIIYKKIPYIYNKLPSDDDLYSLFRLNAKLIRRDVSSVIYLNLDNKIKYSKGRKYNLSLAKKNNLSIHQNENFTSYWSLLSDVLLGQHQSKPVHSLNEISCLIKKFPNNIKLFEALSVDEVLLAGAVVYITDTVVHLQYLANSNAGRQVGALDFVIDYLITLHSQDKKYFDFGISNENNGLILNKGLIEQKEGFGARAVCHDFYKIEVD